MCVAPLTCYLCGFLEQCCTPPQGKTNNRFIGSDFEAYSLLAAGPSLYDAYVRRTRGALNDLYFVDNTIINIVLMRLPPELIGSLLHPFVANHCHTIDA